MLDIQNVPLFHQRKKGLLAGLMSHLQPDAQTVCYLRWYWGPFAGKELPN